MGTTYLIDGYNLLYAMGVLGGRVGPHGLEKARARLLGLLHGAFGEEAAAVTVVFDAAQAPPGLAAEQDYRGVHVVFAKGKQEADDVIEKMIRQASVPKSLQIVSDDHRIQQAARRRKCQVLGCEQFLNWLDGHRQAKKTPAVEQPEKKEGLSQREINRWLAEFGDLDNDPYFRDVFGPY
jgi:uncharacterized protein